MNPTPPSTTETPFIPIERRDRDLSIASIPKPRLGTRIRRWLIAALIVQTAFTAIALLALQTPWRTHARIGTLQSTAAGIANQLATEIINPANPNVRRIIDSATTIPGLRFATIIDAHNHVVVSSTTHAAGSHPQEPEPFNTTIAAGLNRASNFGRSLVFSAPIGSDHRNRLVIGVADLAGERAVLDGGAALILGLVATIIVFVPLAFWRVRRSAAALTDLHKAIRRLAKGLPPDPVAPKGDDDTAYLALAFNSMAADIIANQHALRDANATLERRVAIRTEELRHANDALTQSNASLAEVTDTALRFTDDVAHDFRTPLAVILEFASLMEEGLTGPVSPEQAEHLGFIMDAARDLSHLVDDFLDTSRLRAGRLRVQREPHSVQALVDSAWKMLEVKAAERRITLRRNLTPSLPPVFADTDKVRRVLMNLIVNAIKFSNEGSEVVVNAAAHSHTVSISVIDQGPGMSERDAESLFQRFRQTATGLRSSSKGFGLGLSITAELVAINLGTLSVQSALGKGSTFSFTLPLANNHAILHQFIERTRERNPAARIGALVASLTSGAWTPDQLRDHLVDRARPHDAQLPSDDPRSILLVGEIDTPKTWCDRFTAPEAPIGDAPVEPHPFSADLIGTWSLNASSTEDMIHTILSASKMEASHAA